MNLSGAIDGTLLYLDLMKKCLTRSVFEEPYRSLEPPWRLARAPLALLQAALGGVNLELVRRVHRDEQNRAEGRDWPAAAETMIGLRRLDHLQFCATTVLRDGVPGDLAETGVWRGGAVIFMRAMLKAYGDRTRTVWAADSFQGIPPPNAAHYPADAEDQGWTQPRLSVSLEDVKKNFRRYELLDDQVRFLPGWFRDTLPTAPIEHLALLRLDGDLYESTMDALTHLYPKVSPGGFVIIDDYGGLSYCRKAVDDYRRAYGITEELTPIDWTGVFWRRPDRD
jgi:O-methyltransferase